MRIAGSVWIVSHSDTVGVVVLDDEGNRITKRLVEGGKLNNKVIKEQFLLNGSETSNLLTILARPNEDRKIEMAKCFIPFHAVIWKSKGKLLWLEISFDCNRIAASKELSISESDFDERKWKELLDFYKHKGIAYNLKCMN